jgi:hypothetical protein
MAQGSVRQPVQEFLRQCQLLLDKLNNNESLTALEVVLLKAYMKRIRTCLMTHDFDSQIQASEHLPTITRMSNH